MKLVVILIVLLFLIVKPAEAMVTWSNNQETVASGSKYIPSRSYGFQITWTADEYHTVKNIILESNFSTLNGNLGNDTITFTEGTPITVTKTFVDLPGGRYLYRWYASDNESNWAYNDRAAYTIDQNNSISINLYLNGTENNRSYKSNDVTNFTAFLNTPNKLVFLDSTYPGFVQQSSSTSSVSSLTSLSSPGIFSVTAYWNGDVNYTASSKIYYFDNIPPQFTIRGEYPLNPPEYYPYMVYNFSMVWSDLTLSNVWFESNFSGTLKNYTNGTTPAVQSASNNFFISMYDLPAEEFQYRWIASDTANNVMNTTYYFYTVLKRYPLYIQKIPSTSVMKGTKTTFICNSVTEEISASNFKFYRNNSLIANDTSSSRKDEQTLNEGVYEYVCNNTETQNFTEQTSKVILYVGLTNVTEPETPKTLNLTGPYLIELNPNDTYEASFFLKNNLGETISNLSVDLAGVSSNWYNISEFASSIPNNFSLLIKIGFNIPTYAELGDYNLTLRALGKTNETKVTTKAITLKISAAPPPQLFPPVYSIETVNATSNGNIYEFVLKWNDEIGLSGYMFSSNISGQWSNDSWIPCTGTECWSYASMNMTVQPQGAIGWKFYANDSNGLWTASEEFFIKKEIAKGSDDIFLPIIIVSVFVVLLAVVILFVTKLRSKPKASKKEDVVYVYRKEDLKS
jgi:hypothetical protein